MSASPKIFHLSYDDFGLSEVYHEFQREPLFYILCDALYLPKPELNGKIAKNFERVIKKYILLRKNEFSEKLLIKAVAHAQKYFLKNYTSIQGQLKVCATIVIQEPFHQSKPNKRTLYVAGLGDIKLFSIASSPKLMFYDPEISLFSDHLSLKKRFQYITNSIGTPNYKLKITKIDADESVNFALSTYGIYNEMGIDRLFSSSTTFESKKNQVHKLFSKFKDHEHCCHYVHFSLKSEASLKEPYRALPISKNDVEAESTKSCAKSTTVTIFKALAIGMVMFCLFQLGNHYSLSPQNNAEHTSFKSPHKEPEMQLNLKSLKQPFKFPFLKERAFVIDLKNRCEKQVYIIEKLNQKIREQNKALRDLQMKNFRPLSTAHSAKYPELAETENSPPPITPTLILDEID